MQGQIEAAAEREAYQQEQIRRYTQPFNKSTGSRAALKGRAVSITVVRPGVYRVSADAVDEGVINQIQSLMRRLKKRIRVNGQPMRSKKAAFQLILELMRGRRTVEISVI